jgi:hypothetical protein
VWTVRLSCRSVRSRERALEREASDVGRVWTVVKWLIVAFFVYAIVKSPGTAADIVHTIFQWLADAVRGIGTMFDSLLNR